MKAKRWHFKALMWRYRKLPKGRGARNGLTENRYKGHKKVQRYQGEDWTEGRDRERWRMKQNWRLDYRQHFLKNYEGGVKKFESVAQVERMPVDAWKKAGDVFFSFFLVALVRDIRGVLISKLEFSQNFRKVRINLAKSYGSVSYRYSELNDILLCFSCTNRLPFRKLLNLGKSSTWAHICLCINGRVSHCCHFLLRDYLPLSTSFIPTVNNRFFMLIYLVEQNL